MRHAKKTGKTDENWENTKQTSFLDSCELERQKKDGKSRKFTLDND